MVLLYSVLKVIVNFIFRILYRIEVIGIENVPLEGRFVLCANHANNLDPFIISIVFPRQICWMSKKELFKNKLLAKLLLKLGVFPVDRGDVDISAIKKSLKILKNEGVLGLFPEGTRVRGFDISNAKPGVALLAYKSKAKVVPVNIDSNYKFFNRVRITIGEPIDYFLYNENNKDYFEISKNILSTIYNLKQGG